MLNACSRFGLLNGVVSILFKNTHFCSKRTWSEEVVVGIGDVYRLFIRLINNILGMTRYLTWWY